MERLQNLMTIAYDRWESGWSKQDFWDQLNADERFAVFVGNLNYQVENGGFSQWWSNRYAEPEVVGYLLRACERVGTEAALKVGELLKRFVKATRGKYEDEFSEVEWSEIANVLEELDSQYDEVKAQFLADCEAHISK